MGLSLSGDEVRVWFRHSGDTWAPVCLGDGHLGKLGDEGGH